MIGIHVTNSGRRFLIADMQDSHLRNTILMHLRKTEKASVYTAQKILTDTMYPYLAEAFTRNLDTDDDTRARLKALRERCTAGDDDDFYRDDFPEHVYDVRGGY
jgi:hypothetical protein